MTDRPGVKRRLWRDVQPRALADRWARRFAVALPIAVGAAAAILPSLAAEKSAAQTFETIVEGAVIKPGKAIAKAAGKAFDDFDSSGDRAAPKKKRVSKTKIKTDPDEVPVAAADEPVKPSFKKKSASDASSKPGAASRDAEQLSDVPPSPPLPPPSAADHKPAIATPAAAPAATSAKIPPSFPKTVEQAKSEEAAKSAPPQTWTDAEVTDAKARCDAILKRIRAVAIPQPPIRQGACGTPAPIQLISLGSNPEVAISPPATMTCELAEALDTWLEKDLQPLAKKSFGAEIIKIENMSDYSCRNAYGRAKNKLSEHGVANALDIRGFVTSTGKTAYVLEHWGTPQREILARIAEEKAAAEKAAADKLAADKAAQANQIAEKSNGKTPPPPTATGSTLGTPAAGGTKTVVEGGTTKLKVTLPGAREKAEPAAYGLTESSKLGGPKPSKLGGPKAEIKLQLIKPAPEPAFETRREFLHIAHQSACQIFGTTLGPEANAAHRNHFHVDMAPRKVKKICD